MAIRRVTYDDSNDLGFIHSESFREAYKNIFPGDWLENFTAEKRAHVFRSEISSNTSESAVITLDGNRFGFVTLGANRDADLDSTYGEVWGMYLLPEYWGKGYGKKLMSWGESRLKQRGYRKITLWVLEENVNGRMFYESIGYQWDGTTKEVIIGRKLNETRYFKKV